MDIDNKKTVDVQDGKSMVNEFTTNSQVKKPKILQINPYFAHQLKADIDALKNYAQRKTSFKNIDEQQFFSPGLYVMQCLPPVKRLSAGNSSNNWQKTERVVFTALTK